MMGRGWVNPHIAKSVVIRHENGFQLLSFAEDCGVVCPCQAQLLSALDLEPQIFHQADRGRERVLIGEEVSHELDGVDFLFLHEGLGIPEAGEDVLFGEVVVNSRG